MVKRFFLFLFITVTIISILVYIFLSKVDNRDSILLGASLPLTGINKELGKDVIEGANTYFSHINARGGINGKHINFIYYDDKYEPQNTLKNINTLINKDKVFSLFGFVGTPTTKKVLPIIIDEDIPFIAPYTGASFLRNSHFNNIINFRSSYKEEIERIVNYLYKHKQITKFAIFYQNDDYGEEGYIATIEALKKRSLELISEGTYKRNTLSIRHALHEIKSTKPEAIIIVGAYKPSAHFIKKARECCFNDVIFAPISFVNANALINELNGDGKNILFSQTVPSYDDRSLHVVNEYQNLLSFYYPTNTPSYASFESFLIAKLVVNALQNIKGSLTPKNFLTNMKNLPHDILGEIPIKYKNTQLLNITYLSIYENHQFKPIDRKK
jgi:ABC-type branched-subunit amino acid transport system substrate-binding protein